MTVCDDCGEDAIAVLDVASVGTGDVAVHAGNVCTTYLATEDSWRVYIHAGGEQA
mgnify:CR=1 FL=1